MRATRLCSWFTLLAFFCTACSHKTSSAPQQAQAPPLQTGKGTLPPVNSNQQQEKSETPLASPLPPPSAQNVPLPPPPPPKKVRRRVKTVPAKPADTAQAPAAGSGSAQPPAAPDMQRASATAGTGSPIGQLTTGDSALGEKTKRETVDMIGETQQGLNGIKRSLSAEEKATASQIHNYLKQAQQALESGDTDGAHLLAIKARTLLDELTKP